VGIEVFQDVLSLNPGDRWEQELYREIDRADVFFLFWSKATEESQWVLREINYAVKHKGGDEAAPPEIMPIPLELPIVKPPKSLAHLHFNDPILPAIQTSKEPLLRRWLR